MAENSKIEWCDHSVNWWWGCVEVGPGCDNCYARELSKRWGFDVWGTDKPRREMPNAFKEIAKFQRKAKAEGKKRTVFINSMSDLAELLPVTHPSARFMYEARSKFMQETVHECPDLIFIWLTKRIGNVPKIVPSEWMQGDWPASVWLVPSIVNQKEADRDIPKLLEIPAKVRGLSMEPLLGPVDLLQVGGDDFGHGSVHSLTGQPWEFLGPDEGGQAMWGLGDPSDSRINWVVVGGESGPKARPMHPQWARALRDSCYAFDVPFFFKQHGQYLHDSQYPDMVAPCDPDDWMHMPTAVGFSGHREFKRVGKHKAGRLLDGREWNEFPEVPNA